MANVNVTYDEMREAATKLVNGQTEIEGKLTELTSLVNSLVNGGYVTDASSKSFQGSYEGFTKGANEVVSGLTGMSDYLKTAAQTFQDADTSLASSMNR